MKKNKKIIGLILIIIIVIILVIAVLKLIENNKYNDKLTGTIITKEWSRAGEGDTETIYFTKKGEFGYYCACGNAVDDYDLCDEYKYDKETKTIKLECSPIPVPNKIKIIKNTEYELVLEIAGKKKTFHSHDYHMLDNPLEFADIEFESDNKEINMVFERDGSYEAYDSKKQEYTLGSDYCWDWNYDKKNNEITINCNDETTRKVQIKSYKDDNLELYFEYENKTIKFHKK